MRADARSSWHLRRSRCGFLSDQVYDALESDLRILTRRPHRNRYHRGYRSPEQNDENMLFRPGFRSAATLTLAPIAALLISHVPLARAQEAASTSAQASTQSTAEDIQSLEQRLKADERKLRELERLQHKRQKSNPKENAIAKWGSKGFGIASADGSNVLNMGGLIQADGRYFANNSAPSSADTWLLRHVEP